VRWENKNTCRWPVLFVISMPKNLSKRTVLLQFIIKNVVTCFFGTQCINKLLHRNSSSPLPTCTSASALADSLASFFTDKISKLRLSLTSSSSTSSSPHSPSSRVVVLVLVLVLKESLRTNLKSWSWFLELKSKSWSWSLRKSPWLCPCS